MYDTLIELSAGIGATAVRAVGALCAAVAGVFVEFNGIQTLGTGDQLVGVWMAALGAIMLIACFVLARDALGLLRQPTA